MALTGIWNLIAWLYISLFCELIYRKVVKSIKNRKPEHSDDDNSSDDEKNDEKTSLGAATKKVKSKRENKKTSVKFNKEAYNRDIGVNHKSIFGENTDLSDIHAAAEESSIDETLKKVISYYDKSGNLLYQKEKDAQSNSPIDAINTKFHIKPKLSMAKINNNLNSFHDDGRKEYVASKVSFDEEIDKTFSDIFESLPRL